MKTPDPEAIPMTVQERAKFAKAIYHNIVRPIHSAVSQLEIKRQNNKGLTPQHQPLPKQALDLLIGTRGELDVPQRA